MDGVKFFVEYVVGKRFVILINQNHDFMPSSFICLPYEPLKEF